MVRIERVLVATLLLIMGGSAQAEIVERVVAKVNQDIISKTELDDMVEVALRARKTPPPSAQDRAKLVESVLDRMIADRLIVQAARAKGIKVNDSEVAPQVDQELDALKDKFPTLKAFNAQLREEGITYDDLRNRYLRQMKDRFLYLKMMNLKQRELEAAVEIEDSEVVAYYEANKARGDWMTGREVRARHIQFGVDSELKGQERKRALAEAGKRAKAALAALARGEDFAEVAKTFSEDASTRDLGGDLGRFPRGTFDKSLENAIFELKEGKTGGPVETPVGLHLVKVEAKFEPRMKTLEDMIRPEVPLVVAPQAGAPEVTEMTLDNYIRSHLRNKQLSRRLQDWVEQLRSRALIERFLEEPAKS
jgi:parvulin-like peptidyl-prolyl isomerase